MQVVYKNCSSGPPRLTPRVSQLRQEERVEMGREAAHERELHSAMQMSQSCEDLTIMSGLTSCKTEHLENRRTESTRMVHQLPPLHLSLPICPPVCSSPSPTRPGLGRQSYSPGIHNMSWKSLSPSPTRKAFTTKRSQSPIAIRPSSLGPVKRKFDLEEEKTDQYLSPPAKRPNSFTVDRGGLLMAHSNRLDATSSPLPGSLSSVGTPESLSSADSPGFTFRPVDSPSPGRPILPVTDEPMHEERQPELSKQDQVMTSVEHNPS
ncbi:protein FAM122A isoform X2 [Zootermopsis nevadensis]|uniref:protein FAM122A isoform X2 n=1 Tax=Zootermopsis nevadensis TaxID=136037 RepID=UPI000B8E6FEA|nr:protein FAM122A isoform X2 [Zootermopsis nevadensis]